MMVQGGLFKWSCARSAPFQPAAGAEKFGRFSLRFNTKTIAVAVRRTPAHTHRTPLGQSLSLSLALSLSLSLSRHHERLQELVQRVERAAPRGRSRRRRCRRTPASSTACASAACLASCFSLRVSPSLRFLRPQPRRAPPLQPPCRRPLPTMRYWGGRGAAPATATKLSVGRSSVERPRVRNLGI